MTSTSFTIRKRLVRLVESFPGLHLRELARRSEISEPLAGYHLDGLADEGIVVGQMEGNFRRFYVLKGPAPPARDRDLVGLLRQRVPLQIALLLLDRPGATHQEITQVLGLAKSTVSYHLSRLQAEGFLRPMKEDAGFALASPKRVERLLLAWEPPKDLTTRFEGMWRGFYADRKRIPR